MKMDAMKRKRRDARDSGSRLMAGFFASMKNHEMRGGRDEKSLLLLDESPSFEAREQPSFHPGDAPFRGFNPKATGMSPSS
jgi:hypothetical protein